MKIVDITVLNGRNIYSHKPVIKMLVDLEDLSDKATVEFENFNDTLVKLFPNLIEHHCGLRRRGGFIERLREGTYFGHVFEHLTLELQAMLGYDVYFGKTRIQENPSIYNIIFEYDDENVAIECARQSINIIEDIINYEEFDLENIMYNLKKLKSRYELGPSSKAIFNEAKRRGIPVRRLGNESIIELGYGKYSRLVQAALTDSTSAISIDIACNKQLTKQLLKENNIPVPFGGIAYTRDEAIRIADDIGYPIVLKPLDGNQGKGVVINICSSKEIKRNFKIPMRYSNRIIVEKYIAGKDYRVLIVNGKVCAVAERTAPKIIGDGIHTVKELFEIENKNELRGEGHEKPQTKIKLDKIALNCLRKNNLNEFSIPNKGQVVKLRENGNISTGGTARECTKEIHPDNIEIAINCAKIIGLDIAGIDITTQDISKSIRENGGAIIEVNAVPGLRMHLYPTFGENINVAGHILDSLYPEGKPYSVPIISITGTNGKTTTTRLIGYTLSLTQMNVGMTTTSGIFIGDKCILKGDNTGPLSIRNVLSNREIDVAVLEVARGGIVRKGLCYDLADVAVLTNISDDHIGIDGIKNIEDLAFAKSLVVEAVKPNGYSILNADDKMIEYFLKRASGNIILFSKTATNDIIVKHIRNGRIALCVEDGYICIYSNHHKTRLIELDNIPITFHGALECNIENALAATCALYALNTPLEIIIKGLMSFEPNIKNNPGRFNIFDLGNIKVMLDYGHNIGGYEEVGKFIRILDASRTVGVIGVPGDRTNESIFKVGAESSKIFSKIYIKEDRDLRGRKPGEVAQILYNGLISQNFNSDNIKIILDEIEALKVAISEAQNGDFITLFYEEFAQASNLVNELQSNICSDNSSKNTNDIKSNQEYKIDIIVNEEININDTIKECEQVSSI